MAAYATITQVREFTGLDIERLPDVDAQRLLDEAQLDIDTALGPGWRPYVANDGRALDPITLDARGRDALVRATVAQTAYRLLMGPAHFTGPGLSVEGEEATEGAPWVSPEAIRHLDRVGLRRMTGRVV